MNERPHRNCPNCGMEIWAGLNVCPNCGAKMRTIGNKFFIFGILGMIIGVVLNSNGIELGGLTSFFIRISVYSMFIGMGKYILWDHWHSN